MTEPQRKDLAHSSEVVTLRQHVETQFTAIRQVLDERDRYYVGQFTSSKEAVAAALTAAKEAVSTATVAAKEAVAASLSAQEKATSAAFLASEKAIVKAEDAQREYNVRSNEFRGQLDDQAKMLMPRAEVAALLKSMEDKVGGVKADLNKFDEGIRKEIVSLRESRSELSGKSSGAAAMWGYVFAAVSVAGALLTAAFALVRLGRGS